MSIIKVKPRIASKTYQGVAALLALSIDPHVRQLYIDSVEWLGLSPVYGSLCFQVIKILAGLWAILGRETANESELNGFLKAPKIQ